MTAQVGVDIVFTVFHKISRRSWSAQELHRKAQLPFTDKKAFKFNKRILLNDNSIQLTINGEPNNQNLHFAIDDKESKERKQTQQK